MISFKKDKLFKKDRLVHKPFIKADKLGRICSIYWKDAKSDVTPEEFKETLNMFRGRQIRTSLKECLDYLHLSLAKQRGDVEAIKQMNQIHKSWNA